LGGAVSRDQQGLVRQFAATGQYVVDTTSVGQYLAVVAHVQFVSPGLDAQVGLEAFGEHRRFAIRGAILVPVRDLDTDEHTDHDNHEIDDDCGPVLGLHVLDDAAQDHQIISRSQVEPIACVKRIMREEFSD